MCHKTKLMAYKKHQSISFQQLKLANIFGTLIVTLSRSEFAFNFGPEKGNILDRFL